MDLPKEELLEVVGKVESVLKEVDFHSVPPIVYHLILLVKGKIPGRVLQAVIDFFNAQEESLVGNRSQGRRRTGSEGDSFGVDSEAIGGLWLGGLSW